MISTTKKDPKHRKNILIVDSSSELELAMREPLLKQFENSEVSPILVRAKDGAEAAIKSVNQKFDLLLIDTDAPRLMDGGFVHGLQTYKNTQGADIMVLSQMEFKDLPASLQFTRYFKKPVVPTQILHAMTEVLNSQHQNAEAKSSASKSSKYAVDVRVINAIIKSTINVLKQFGCSNIKMGQACTQSPHTPLMGEISSVVDIRSQHFHGYLCVSFDKGSFLEVVSLMLMEEQTELTPDNQDAVGEINNIIFGNAKREISSFGIELTVPRVLPGAKQSISCPDGSAGMMIPFSTDKGHFYISVIALPAANIN